MNVKINSDVLKGGLFTLLALALWFATPLQIELISQQGVNARSFPRLALGIMLFSGMGIMVKGLFGRDKQYIELSWNAVMDFKIPFVVFALMGIYMYFITTIGFLISSLVIVNLTLILLKSRKKVYYLTCNVVVALIFFIFTSYLNVLLPT